MIEELSPNPRTTAWYELRARTELMVALKVFLDTVQPLLIATVQEQLERKNKRR